MDKFDRIYQLNDCVKNTRTAISLTEIQNRLECSKATAKRIISYYRDFLAAPLIYDPDIGGYRLDHAQQAYELPGLWFNDSELFALMISHRLLTDIQPGLLHEKIQPIRQRIEKLLTNKKLGGDELDKRIRILQMAYRPVDLSKFRTIASAVVQQCRMQMLYHGRQRDKISERQVSPQRIVYYRDNWYLDAWCHEREALRTFAIDRIEPVKLLEQPALEMTEQQLDELLTNSYGIFAGPAIHTAHLRFSPYAAKWVADEQWHPQQKTQIDRHGNLQLWVPYHNPTELIRDILKYGDQVEVLAPEALRQAIASTLQNAAKQYEKG